MRFLVVERARSEAFPSEPAQSMKIAADEMRYKLRLQKERKIVGGGPFLDIQGVCYILETKTIEEMGDVFFNSPANFFVDREVHPLGSFQDTLEGIKELQSPKKRSRK